MPEGGQTGAGCQSDVAGSDHGDASSRHRRSPFSGRWGCPRATAEGRARSRRTGGPGRADFVVRPGHSEDSSHQSLT
ncbi:hypothetical protein STAFG_5751 [Streptomyces afghaniensis 772]|uniref:Uncharacterized protein n=1 Tax=Streptomyces afghaniensis 772 TaxID=1283301 RepID=S4NFF1_9ACTN|nr:hypothetical protein STAFG_5751 [Streptomyces afghaniensis 772]